MHAPQDAPIEGPRISIVSTMYRSRPFLEEFLDQSLAALAEIECRHFEIVLVNDGSPDDSLEWAVAKRAELPELVVVDLSRNFGHHAAMQAGLSLARGELVFLIDCDLEVSPMVLVDMHAKLLQTKSDMVYGYQEARKGGWVERRAGGMFYRVFNSMSDVRIPENMTTERLMTRRFVQASLELGDKNLFIGGMLAWTGYQQIGIPIPKGQREGASSYTFMRRLRLMVDAISAFSAQPLTLLFNAGVSITGLSVLYIAYLVARKILFDDTLTGFTSLMALVTLSLGMTTMGLGVIGIYLGKVYKQVQNRPTFIVRDVHRAP
ncbi:glycosyltransferase family 2 protein [Roseateles sp. DXS20W]|uniref:Glycosyltransferase family 2 protein n=1 Tax=Pelomonas lactea TaxID=3299030 RepID=A0ABW7GRP9_9BURK